MSRFLQTTCLSTASMSRRILQNIIPVLNFAKYLNDHFLIGLFRRRGTTK
jgi:hypothetical protein